MIHFGQFLLIACAFAFARADVQPTCSGSVVIGKAEPVNQPAGGVVKKGIPFSPLDQSVSAADLGAASDCNKMKETCFDRLKTKMTPTPPGSGSVTSVVRVPVGKNHEKLICIIVGKSYKVQLQVNMEYHCVDGAQATEVITTKIDRNYYSDITCP